MNKETSKLPEDLRVFEDGQARGGATAHIYVSIKGNVRHYWYAVGDAAQAIKRIEQDLHDNPPDDWSAFRELHLAASDYGYLNIADSVEAAVSLHNKHQPFPWLVLDLNRQTTRRMLSSWLKGGLGKYGTADMV